jgi:hypothetical protein
LGYFLSGNKTLKSAYESDSNLNCSELYQQTEVLPNPLNDSSGSSKFNLNDYNIKFTIGDEICSGLDSDRRFCNGPLATNTRYGLFARIFTRAGFRDTQAIYIEDVVHPFELVSPMIAVAGSATLIVLLSLIILVCCLQSAKKKRRLLKEKKAAAEADENLLSFTSYCVLDKNPLPRKSYDE